MGCSRATSGDDDDSDILPSKGEAVDRQEMTLSVSV